MNHTSELIEKLHKARASMIADPSFLNESIAKLTPEAQKYAIEIRDIVLNEDDASIRSIKITSIRSSVSDDILKELDSHRDEIAKKYT